MSTGASGKVGRDDNLMFVGPSHRGKTHRALHNLTDTSRESHGRWVYIDPMGTAEVDGSVDVTNRRDLLRQMAKQEFRIMYRYDDSKSSESYMSVITTVAQYAEAARIKMTLACDEIGAELKLLSKDALRPWANISRRGAHYGLAIIAISQRLFDIDYDTRSNFEVCHICGVNWAYDVKALNEMDLQGEKGAKLGDVARTLAKHHAIRYTLADGSWSVLGPKQMF